MALTFYRCTACGEMVMVVEKGSCVPHCCGKEMTELKPNTVDAAVEKHVPAVEKDGHALSVKVGEVAHPMTEEHSIVFIAAEKENGSEIKYLKPGDKPEVVFSDGNSIKAVYAYCNLHGLWKKEI